MIAAMIWTDVLVAVRKVSERLAPRNFERAKDSESSWVSRPTPGFLF
jgi:hypothetical protein